MMPDKLDKPTRWTVKDTSKSGYVSVIFSLEPIKRTAERLLCIDFYVTTSNNGQPKMYVGHVGERDRVCVHIWLMMMMGSGRADIKCRQIAPFIL